MSGSDRGRRCIEYECGMEGRIHFVTVDISCYHGCENTTHGRWIHKGDLVFQVSLILLCVRWDEDTRELNGPVWFDSSAYCIGAQRASEKALLSERWHCCMIAGRSGLLHSIITI